MDQIKKRLSENILDKFSMDFLRNQVLKNAYGNDDTFIAALDPRLLLVWYAFFALVPWFADNLIFLLGCFLLVAVTTVMATGCRSGVGSVWRRSVLTDRIFVCCIPSVRRKCRDGGAAFDLDAEGCHSVFGFCHCVFRPGSGPPFQWTYVVWLPGETVFFHLLCLPDAAYADGGISECAPVLPTSGKCAGQLYLMGKSAVFDLSD